jgi:hypothetical protein
MKSITISFTDFWPTFNFTDNFFIKVLSAKYDVKVVNPDEGPDLLIYSFNGCEFLKYNGLKVYFTGENDVPDFNFCDYGISFHPIQFNDRHLRLPLYVKYPAFEMLRSNRRVINKGYTEREFCSMVVSNVCNCDPTRLKFFDILSQYKPVASGGRFANNVGGPVNDKLEFISKYKFNIAFENSAAVGYTTEKLIEALCAATVPIYWGDPVVGQDVNKRSFIDVRDFSSFEKAIEYIKKVDLDDDLYMEYINSPALGNNPFLNWEEILFDFLDSIIIKRKRYTVDYGINGTIFQRRILQERLYSFPSLRTNIEKIAQLSQIKNKLWKPFRH